MEDPGDTDHWSPAGDPSEHTGLVYAAFPEHAVVASGAVGPCCGRDVVPAGPLQVSTVQRAGLLHVQGGQTWAGLGRAASPALSPAFSLHSAVPLADSR